MYVLVINCGSSSLKAAILEQSSGERIASVKIGRIGGDAELQFNGVTSSIKAKDHEEALENAIPAMLELLGDNKLSAVGHRVVHGGDQFVHPTLIDNDVEKAIEALIPIAPLHNPANLSGIHAARKLVPDVPHIAVFDTAFHGTLPKRAKTYAIDQDVAKAKGLRRYGFHGISHAYVAERAADFMDAQLRDLRVITCLSLIHI